jgi:SAM-dependent methyltransferase
MSSYESYDERSAHYDHTRGSVGIEIIVGCLAQGETPLAEMTLLDAGCGTGNYSAALLAHVARIEAVDLSACMLEVARRKLADAAARNRVVFHRGSIDALPLADGAVDGVVVNQVLHHLPDDPTADWPMHRKVVRELARVLKPAGICVINSCSHAQIEQGFWPYYPIPAARDATLKRLMPLDRLEVALGEAGIRCRAGDSIWALVGAAELAEVERTLRDLDRQGALEAYLREHDARRPDIGQITLLYGSKD